MPSWSWTNTWKHCWTYLLSIPSRPQRTGVPVWRSGGARVRAPSTWSDCRLLWWPADLNLVEQVAHSWSSARAHQREMGCGETHEDHWPRSRCSLKEQPTTLILVPSLRSNSQGENPLLLASWLLTRYGPVCCVFCEQGHASGNTTLAKIVDPQDVATNVMEDITIPFAHTRTRLPDTHQ